MRKGIIIGVVGAAVALAGGATGVRLSQGSSDTTAPTTLAAIATAEISRTTLVQTSSVDGTVSFGASQPVESKASGTITWLPKAGDTVVRGQALLRADELPVVLLYGELPSYRPLAPDTFGDDVKQFETNLRALGYTGFTVETSAAVKRWQHDL